VALCAVIGGGIGAFMELRSASAYVATIRVFATSKGADNVPISQTTTLAVQRMESYVRLADSTRLADRLISRLGLGMTPGALSARISANLEKDTVIMTVTVGADTADQARAIAEALPSEYTSLVNQLVDVPVSAEDATIFTTIDGPDVGKSSSPTRLGISIIFGAVLGGAVGMAIASVRARRLAGRTPLGVSSLTGLPVVGVIPSGPLQEVHSHRASDIAVSRTLAYQRLAVNLPLLAAQTHRLVVVTSAGRGMGSSSVSVELATALAQRGQRVLLVDATPHDNAVTDAIGVQPAHHLGEVLAGSIEVSEAIETVPGPAHLEMLSLGNVDDAVSGPDERRALMTLLKRLRKEFDTVVIDATPVIDAHGLPTGLDLADAVLLVVDQFGASREDTVAASESLRAMAVPNIGVVMNRVVPRTVPRRQLMSGVVLPSSAGESPDAAPVRG
jgi:receptor protein-tyrosine kinase